LLFPFNFYSRSDQSLPTRKRTRGIESDGTAIEEKIIIAICRNCQSIVTTRASRNVPYTLGDIYIIPSLAIVSFLL